MAGSRGAGRGGRDEFSAFLRLAFRAAGSPTPPPARCRRPPAWVGAGRGYPGCGEALHSAAPPRGLERGAGRFAEPGFPLAAVTHALELLGVGADPEAHRGSGVLGHRVCGGWTRCTRVYTQTHTQFSARAHTHIHSHTHTHTPPRGATAGGGEYWFRYRGRAAPRPRARAGAPTLTKHTCLGTGDKASAEKCLGCSPAALPGHHRPRDTAPRPGSRR